MPINNGVWRVGRIMLNSRVLLGPVVWIVLVIAGLPGCADQNGQPSLFQAKPDAASKVGEPTPAEVARMLEPNVLGISCLYDPFNPWIWDLDRTYVRGVKVGALYLLGPKSTGVFGDGVIRPRLTVAQRNEKGEIEQVLVKEWALDVEEAMPFRAKKRSRWGWGYGLFLTWGDINLMGRDIRLTVTFERSDGYVITGTRKDFRVPGGPKKG